MVLGGWDLFRGLDSSFIPHPVDVSHSSRVKAKKAFSTEGWSLGGSQPSPESFNFLRVQRGFPFSPPKVKLFAGDLRTAQVPHFFFIGVDRFAHTCFPTQRRPRRRKLLCHPQAFQATLGSGRSRGVEQPEVNGYILRGSQSCPFFWEWEASTLKGMFLRDVASPDPGETKDVRSGGCPSGFVCSLLSQTLHYAKCKKA